MMVVLGIHTPWVWVVRMGIPIEGLRGRPWGKLAVETTAWCGQPALGRNCKQRNQSSLSRVELLHLHLTRQSEPTRDTRIASAAFSQRTINQTHLIATLAKAEAKFQSNDIDGRPGSGSHPALLRPPDVATPRLRHAHPDALPAARAAAGM